MHGQRLRHGTQGINASTKGKGGWTRHVSSGNQKKTCVRRNERTCLPRSLILLFQTFRLVRDALSLRAEARATAPSQPICRGMWSRGT